MTQLDDETLAELAMSAGSGALALDALPPLLAEVVRLRATIEQVRALHRQITTTDDYGFCTGCEYQWPCPTVAALAPAGADRQEQP